MTHVFRPLKDEVLARIVTDPRAAEQFLYKTPVGASDFALGAEAAGVHFLLTGTAEEGEWPLNFVLGHTLGKGRAVRAAGEEHPPAVAFTSAEVHEIAAGLAELGGEEFLARFDAAAMNEHGVGRADWRDEDERLEGLVDAFAHLRESIVGAAEKGLGVVVCSS